MGRPRIHDDHTRQRLFSVAEGLVSYGGIEALSVRGLAEMAGTTTRAVYSVFEGKEGIVRALYRESCTLLKQMVEERADTADPLEDLVRVGLTFRDFALQRPHLFRLAFEGRLPFVPRQAELAAGLGARRALQHRIERCSAAGLLGDRSPTVATFQFHALCQGLASNELNGFYIGAAHPERLWEDALRSLVRGMAPTPSASAAKPNAGRTRKKPR